jgi:hypothetical protein
VGEEDVIVATLDEVAAGRLGAEERAYLKIDVQGLEMDVLRGAGATLAQVDMIEMELSTVPLYRGQALYREMIDHLAGLGFTLVGLAEGFSDERTGQLLQFDALFERTSPHRAEEGVS